MASVRAPRVEEQQRGYAQTRELFVASGSGTPQSSGPVSGPVQRKEDVNALIERARGWAARRPYVRGLALVGSWARDDANQESDVDLVLLADQPGAYLSDEAWIDELGASSVVRTRSWGALTERRLALPSELEIDVGVAVVSWAATAPVDAGTRQVVTDGIRVVFDLDGVLAELIAAIRR